MGLQWLLGKRDVGYVGGSQACDRETVGNRKVRKRAIMLPAREALLLRGGDQTTVNDKCSICVVTEKTADSEND
jgi:hypothetical protein